MKTIENFVKEHELKTLSSQEEELLSEGMTGSGDGSNTLANCSTNNCHGGNCAAGCGTTSFQGNKGGNGGLITTPINTKCGG